MNDRLEACLHCTKGKRNSHQLLIRGKRNCFHKKRYARTNKPSQTLAETVHDHIIILRVTILYCRYDTVTAPTVLRGAYERTVPYSLQYSTRYRYRILLEQTYTTTIYDVHSTISQSDHRCHVSNSFPCRMSSETIWQELRKGVQTPVLKTHAICAHII